LPSAPHADAWPAPPVVPPPPRWIVRSTPSRGTYARGRNVSIDRKRDQVVLPKSTHARSRDRPASASSTMTIWSTKGSDPIQEAARAQHGTIDAVTRTYVSIFVFLHPFISSSAMYIHACMCVCTLCVCYHLAAHSSNQVVQIHR
jgi:hypothetical protein